MKAPSAYVIGLVWSWLQLPVVIALFLLVANVMAVALGPELAALPAALITMSVSMAIGLWFPPCPRCGLNIFVTLLARRRLYSGSYFFSNMHRHLNRPNDVCSKCGLNLRNFTLFDPTAKRGKRCST